MLVTSVFLVAVAAFESVGFSLSYEALHRVAVDNAVPEHSAWMFPVLVDGGIVLGSVGVIRALASHRSTRPYWTVTVGFTLVSWAFNVSNAPRTAGGWAVATVAPLAQLVALEMGMQELRALLLPQPEAAPQHAPAPQAAPEEAPESDAATTGQHIEQPTDGEQQQEQQEASADDDAQQRQQRQRPPLQPDTTMPWAALYEACSTEEQRIALTRNALPDRPKLTAPQWATDIGKGETRARDLLRAARKPPPADAEGQEQLELLSA
ncbi:DUF2637 domain-containing protein [Streptomyces sp. NPDC002680]|uniref:DUF2637 domain-containing protein n=1 Tax=Streptomyces sp. NPDC002680 TaxID=3364659 RepID=UPI0036A5C4CC